jgi:hypothetical protein
MKVGMVVKRERCRPVESPHLDSSSRSPVHIGPRHGGMLPDEFRVGNYPFGRGSRGEK